MATATFSVPIEDPQFYLDDPWPVFRRMQREAPFYYYEPLDTYVVTRHADVKAIAAMPSVFVNSKGLFLNDLRYQAQAGDELMTDSFFPADGEQVGTTDPPRQQELRRVLAPAFTARALEKLAAPVQSYVSDVLAGIVPGQAVDWIPLASGVPIFASTHLIGLPETDVEKVRFWSDELEKLGSDLSFEELRAAAAEFRSLQDYIADAMERKRLKPGGDDLLTVLLEQELDNQSVSAANVVMFCMTVMAAGSDTTRSLLAGLIHELAQRPDLWELLRHDRSMVPLAIEETLRWVTPARAFVRTAVKDATVGERTFKAGQRVYLMYMAANRDEAVFPHPGTFDITRQESVRHLAFGSGIHICAGSRLVRLQTPIVLNQLLDRFSRVELAGEAGRISHVLRNGWTSMPVIFRR